MRKKIRPLIIASLLFSGCIYSTTIKECKQDCKQEQAPMRTESHTWSCPEYITLDGEQISLALMPGQGVNGDFCFYDEDGKTASIPAVGG